MELQYIMPGIMSCFYNGPMSRGGGEPLTPAESKERKKGREAQEDWEKTLGGVMRREKEGGSGKTWGEHTVYRE